MKRAVGAAFKPPLQYAAGEAIAMRRLLRHSAIALLIYVFVFHPQSFAQDKPLKKINWGVTSLSGGNWIPWIAKEAKIYEKHGSMFN
jgi:hypothetical protein